MYVYYLLVKDEGGRPMRGCWVQERWDKVIALSTQVTTLEGFHVNLKTWHWITARIDTTVNHYNPLGNVLQNGAEFAEAAGVFGPDFIGNFYTPVSLFSSQSSMFSGTHHYWAGTTWCPALVEEVPGALHTGKWYGIYDNPQDPVPTVTQGLGIFIGSYDILITTRGAGQTGATNQGGGTTGGGNNGGGGGTGGNNGGGGGGS
jgi:hypothetical protein